MVIRTNNYKEIHIIILRREFQLPILDKFDDISVVHVKEITNKYESMKEQINLDLEVARDVMDSI